MGLSPSFLGPLWGLAPARALTRKRENRDVQQSHVIAAALVWRFALFVCIRFACVVCRQLCNVWHVEQAFGVCNVCRQLCNVWCISNWRVEQYTELCKKRLVFALFAMFANSTKHGARAD